MAESTIRLYWVPYSSDTYSISSITWNGSHDVFHISSATDYSLDFPVGSTFVVAGTSSNDGTKAVGSVSFASNTTTITTTSTVDSPEGAGGTILVAYHYLEWSWSKLAWIASNPAKHVTDRNGLVTRINSPNSTALQRFFISAHISVFPEDLLKVASNGWDLRTILYNCCFLRDTEFIILDKEIAVNSGNLTYTSLIAGKGYLDNFENVWDSLAIIDAQKSAPALEFTVSSDGTFSTIDAPGGASYRSRP